MPTYPLRTEQDRIVLIRAVSALDLSKPWSIIIERERKKRSLSQNALYWSWLGIIADDTGNEIDELHELFKNKFLKPTELVIGDEILLYRTTTKLTPPEMSEFMAKVEAFATSQLGVILPADERGMG